MQILSFLFTENLPSTLNWTQTGGAAVGGGGAYDFNPKLHDMTGGASVGGTAPVSSAVTYTDIGGGPKVGGGGTGTYFFSGTYYIPMTMGGAFTYSFVDGPVFRLIASLPTPMTSAFTAPNLGQVVQQLPRLQGALAGTPGILGAITTAELPSPPTSVFRSGERVVATLPKITGVLAGTPANVGRVVATLYRPTAVLAGTVTIIGAVVARLKPHTGSLSGYAGGVGGFAASLTHLRGVFTAAVGATGGVVGRLPLLVASIEGRSSIYGTIAVSLPRPLTSVLASVRAWSYVDTLVTNTVTFAPTQYASYGFNSFAEVGGRYLAAKADGIYAVHEGDLDDTAEIPAEFATGSLDSGIRELKRFENLYAAYTTAGNLNVTVTPDKGTNYTYRLAANHTGFAPRRVTIGKGMRGRYWKIAVANINGADFDFASMEAVFAQTARRV